MISVTGLGVASCLGTTVDTFWSALLAGRSGTVSWRSQIGDQRAAAVVAEIPAAPDDPLRPVARATALASHAALAAWADAGVESVDRERVGLVVGTGLGNLDLVEATLTRVMDGRRVSPVAAFRGFAHASACQIASQLDLRGPLLTVSSGCNSGADAVGVALDWMRVGKADVVLAGGTEAELTRGFLGSMSASRALATAHADRPGAASRPFDAARAGKVPGEGAAFVVLERAGARDAARPYAVLRGFAGTAAGRRPPYDPFNPPSDLRPMLRNLERALEDAQLQPSELSAVSANGSSSVFYDTLEATALRALLGESLAQTKIFSIKGAVGQTGAVTPLLQLASAALALRDGVIPPTINVDVIDPACAIPIVREATRSALEHVLCHAIGFGGAYYAAAVLSRA